MTAAASEFTLSLPSKAAAEALSGGETLEVSLPGGLLMGTSGLVPAQTLAITLADCRAPSIATATIVVATADETRRRRLATGCSDACLWSGDGTCDDGGTGATYVE